MNVGLEHIRREIVITLEVIPWNQRLIFFKKLENLVEHFKKAKDPLDIEKANDGSKIK